MTGKFLPALLALFAVVCAVPAAHAQVQVSASLDLDRVPVGHSARLTITVVGADQEIVPPTLPDLDGVNAFGAGQSQRFTFVNGQSRAEYSWSWSLVPRREGVVTIPAIKVTVDGKDYETAPRSLTATPARPSPDPDAGSGDDSPSSEMPCVLKRQ